MEAHLCAFESQSWRVASQRAAWIKGGSFLLARADGVIE